MAKIEFISVSIRNFMSFGNAEITFDYKKGINIVTGKVESTGSRNGCGKSVLLVDSLSFALYGKVLRGGKVILNEIVNKINRKDCCVTAILKINGELIKVERSIKPNDLKIYVGENFELKKFDANGRNQEWLERKIGISHNCFNNIIVLNVNSSIPFLDMEAGKKREVVENILASGVYGSMSNLAKDRHLDLKSELKSCEVTFQATLNHLTSSKNTLLKHQNAIDKQKEDKQKRIDLIKSEICNLETKVKDLEDKQKNLRIIEKDEKSNEEQKIKEIETTINNLRTELKVSQIKLQELSDALKQLENVPHCPLCHTPSDNPCIKEYISKTKEDIKKHEKIINDLKLKGNLCIETKREHESILGDINENLRRNDLFKKEIEMASLKVSHKKNELINEENRKIEEGGVSEEAVKELEEKLKVEQEKLDRVSDDYKHYSTVRQILGEEGLRKFVVSRVLPILNSKVNEYLKILGSEYTVAFNINLEEKILSRNREERPYNSFSSGEKKRLDLSVLLALMDISRMQNSVETNILVLDEVLDTSMDSDGVEGFLEFLKNGFKKSYPDKCIYIITHRKEISGETFDRLINLVKKNNFTEIASVIDMTHPEAV